ncbi:hypothetical protein UGMREWDR_CDS0211 [Aeromonas phage GomatiRiver_11]|nr:hypothetical protein OBDJBBDK_00209 [Aeromonas phage AhFM11]WKW84378.1 hypothetical protein UGMREWDR_CDS0211 [Aeromonas phage GomatiRiver_11]
MTDQQEMTLHIQPSTMIRVWCEYDINGRFGGNNNEEVFRVIFPADIESDTYSMHISLMVEKYVKDVTGLNMDELDGLFDWSYIEPKVL